MKLNKFLERKASRNVVSGWKRKANLEDEEGEDDGAFDYDSEESEDEWYSKIRSDHDNYSLGENRGSLGAFQDNDAHQRTLDDQGQDGQRRYTVDNHGNQDNHGDYSNHGDHDNHDHHGNKINHYQRQDIKSEQQRRYTAPARPNESQFTDPHGNKSNCKYTIDPHGNKVNIRQARERVQPTSRVPLKYYPDDEAGCNYDTNMVMYGPSNTLGKDYTNTMFSSQQRAMIERPDSELTMVTPLPSNHTADHSLQVSPLPSYQVSPLPSYRNYGNHGKHGNCGNHGNHGKHGNQYYSNRSSKVSSPTPSKGSYVLKERRDVPSVFVMEDTSSSSSLNSPCVTRATSNNSLCVEDDLVSDATCTGLYKQRITAGSSSASECSDNALSPMPASLRKVQQREYEEDPVGGFQQSSYHSNHGNHDNENNQHGYHGNSFGFDYEASEGSEDSFEGYIDQMYNSSPSPPPPPPEPSLLSTISEESQALVWSNINEVKRVLEGDINPMTWVLTKTPLNNVMKSFMDTTSETGTAFSNFLISKKQAAIEYRRESKGPDTEGKLL